MTARQAVVAYLIAMPGSTQREIATSLNLNTGKVCVIMHELLKQGIIKKDDVDRVRNARFYFFNQAIPKMDHHVIQTSRTSKGYLDALEAATALGGVHRTTVYNMLRKGELRGHLEKTDGCMRPVWKIDPESVREKKMGHSGTPTIKIARGRKPRKKTFWQKLFAA